MSIGASDSNGWTAVCSLDRLTRDAIVCARVAGLDLLIVRDGEHVHACERACPHEQADLAQGRVADGRLFCPRHQAWFSLHNGEISPGWPSRPLQRYLVRIAEGQVWLRVASASDASNPAIVLANNPAVPIV